MDHAVDFKEHLQTFLLHHLRHEGVVVVVELLQIGLQGQGRAVMFQEPAKAPVTCRLLRVQGVQQGADLV